MLAVLLALLSVAAGLSGGPADDVRAEAWAAAALVGTGDACCDGETVGEAPQAPCPPGEPCPAPGGCCACLTCCKRIADVPATLRPAETGGAPAPEAPGGTSSGIDGRGAVWHPPRG